MAEAKQRIQELEDDLARVEKNLQEAIKRGDEEASKRTAVEREKRELQAQLDELREDFESEKSSKEKVERAKRELEQVSVFYSTDLVNPFRANIFITLKLFW